MLTKHCKVLKYLKQIWKFAINSWSCQIQYTLMSLCQFFSQENGQHEITRSLPFSADGLQSICTERISLSSSQTYDFVGRNFIGL